MSNIAILTNICPTYPQGWPIGAEERRWQGVVKTARRTQRRRHVDDETHCLALDCGASSIRLIDVGLREGRLSWNERARFENTTRRSGDHQIWDYASIYRQITAALRAAGSSGVRYASIGADSWGVDFVLMDERGAMLGAPVSYRDTRTNGQIAQYVGRHLSAHELFTSTGLQCLQFNTLFQLYAQSQSEPDILRRARRLLFTADYAHYWLSGVASNERTLASTSQMLSTDGTWFMPALDSVGLPPSALSAPVPAGTILGTIRPELKIGLDGVRVIAPASHDTQSAVLCTPATGDSDWAYLSSGTWSILGQESRSPVTDTKAERAGIGNESGYGETYCVQSTVAGLWLVQEIQRLLAVASISDLAAQAEHATPFRSIVNPADPRFFNPPDMICEIRAACREAGEPLPETPVQLLRCAYDSLALLYRSSVLKLSAVTGRPVTRLYVVGGGTKARLLNRLCATTTGAPVYAGPAEATALGNAIAQLIALGLISDATEGRRLVRESFPSALFEPEAIPQLDDAIARFRTLSANGNNGAP
jgi:rhamnulokinase